MDHNDWNGLLKNAIESKNLKLIQSVFENSLTQDDFLCGPGQIDDEERLDIDEIFAKTFDQVRKELLAYDRTSLDLEDPACVTESFYAPGYRFVNVKTGLAVLSPDDRIVGGYLSCDLILDDEHQGQGLGREIVIEYFLRHHHLPTWDLDQAAYSPAGQATHESAWLAMYHNPEMVLEKSRVIAMEIGFEGEIDGDQPKRSTPPRP